MQRSLKNLISVLIFFTIMISGISCFAEVAEKPYGVVVNSVSIKVNGKVMKADNFSYAGKTFMQPQDVGSFLGTGYSYDARTKTASFSSKKPVKPISPAKPKFSSIKASTTKSLKMIANSITVKVDGKIVKTESFIHENTVFISLKDIVPMLDKDFSFDAKGKIVSINEKKPTTPVFAPSTMEKTKESVVVTITEWGNAQKKEYKIDNGPWQKYTNPVKMTTNGTISARGTNIAGIPSDIASMEVDNILKLLSKVEIADFKKSVVKVIAYNKNSYRIGTGSGFYITEDGNIVTNYHVIELASFLEIEDLSGKTYNVSGILAYDIEKDLAVLKVEEASMKPYLNIGSSGGLLYGEDVVAIGYPLGMPVNVTYGNIGSLNLDGVLSRTKYKDIQISTPITSGNSGGPLLNMYGEVIGINYANSEGSYVQNLNRTIPVEDLKPMLDSDEVKTISQVKNEIFSKMTYEELARIIYIDYFELESDKYTFCIDEVYLREVKDDSKRLNLYLFQYPESFSEIMKVENDNNKKLVEDWMEKIAEIVKKQYPDKKLDVGLYYPQYVETYPNGQDEGMIFYNKEIGKWAVYRFKVIYYYNEYGVYTFHWN